MMTLGHYLQHHGLTAAEFADRIGVSPEATRRYAAGARIPHQAVMVRIFEVTGGVVTPNDFYSLPTSSSEHAA